MARKPGIQCLVTVDWLELLRFRVGGSESTNHCLMSAAIGILLAAEEIPPGAAESDRFRDEFGPRWTYLVAAR